MAEILLCAWLAWCLFNVGLLLVSPSLMRLLGVGSPLTNGLSIYFPERLREILSPEQQAALMAHEEGHKAHRHALKNLLRACILIPRPQQLAERQEIEADDFAALRGHGPALASALRILSPHPFDRQRAARLESW